MPLYFGKHAIIAIDCGMSFPPHNMPGIDTSIPDVDYLIENSDKLKGIVLTHGHEDHIGAIPYIIESLNVPIYGTPLTIALVEKKLNYLNYSEDVLIDIKDVPTYESKEIIFLTTGNHGEPINCLTEIAEGTHDDIKLLPGDTVLFSSIAIHGSENLFSKTMNLLEEQGANIIFQDIHATGHACIDELKLIDHISLKEVLIDGLGIGNIGKNIISDRTKMGKNGVVIIETCFGASSGRLVAPTRITTRGFVNTKLSTDILPGLEDAVKSEIARLIAQGVTGNKFDSLVQKAAEKYIINECDQRPLVIVLTNEIVL
ncbi:MBL fold metallo-hydrolase [Butyrivibrio sp. XB500-5]|uniref:MBL fold metallo-hydrolase n=1 Tax=Butyrivibrio sp. XB500-5 TaxID=2364880 RepID=UPI0013148CEF|nr:MBL fold metallo-hydrolase [Butyrivibrio sp. XB500-5]